MDILVTIFGEGKDLDIWQMSCRGIVVFFIALGIIRLSGRRSFGLHTSLDNIISIALGAVLSRAVVGASPFVPVVAASAVIALLHRLMSWLTSHHQSISKLVEGKKRLLYSEGRFIDEAMGKALMSEEDMMQGVRKNALTENLDKIEKIYMERNGEVSVVRKE